MERVIDRGRQRWLEENDTAQRVKRDIRGGLRRRKKDNGREDWRSRNGRAMVEARWRKVVKVDETGVNQMKEERRKSAC